MRAAQDIDYGSHGQDLHNQQTLTILLGVAYIVDDFFQMSLFRFVAFNFRIGLKPVLSSINPTFHIYFIFYLFITLQVKFTMADLMPKVGATKY